MYVTKAPSRLPVVSSLALLAIAGALPYEVEHDGVERKMWCKCSTYLCNCAYRLHCRSSPAVVVRWMGTEDQPERCSDGASYSGTCFCHKSCACNTTEDAESRRLYGGLHEKETRPG